MNPFYPNRPMYIIPTPTTWNVGYKRARVEMPEDDNSFFARQQGVKAFEQDTGQVTDTREGKSPIYVEFRWTDSTGNGSSKNYQTFSWNFDPAIEGYSTAELMYLDMTNQYQNTHLFKQIGFKVNEISTPVRCTSSQQGTTLVSPTFLVPNQVYLQGAQNPISGVTSDVIYISSKEKAYTADVRGLTLSNFSITLCDENMQTLTPVASPTGYNFYMMMKFY